MNRYFQGGAAAAYRNVALIKLHYKISRSMDTSLNHLSSGGDEEIDSEEKVKERDIAEKRYSLPGSFWKGVVTEFLDTM